MKTKLAILFSTSILIANSQDVINPYVNLPSIPPHFISGTINPGPNQTTTSYFLEQIPTSFNGEYQVFANFLGNWGNSSWHKTYEIETVSFPFTPQNECAFSANGCTSSVPERILSMPISAYDPITRAWGEVLKAVLSRN